MMRTLRRILAIARKELLVLMGTRQSRFMVLIPPVIQIFIFAWAATMEVKNVDVVVINEDSGYWSQEVISRLRGSPTFRHITFEDDFKKAEEAINRQDVLVVMRTKASFGPTSGIFFSTISIRPLPKNTAAFIIFAILSLLSFIIEYARITSGQFSIAMK